MKPVAFLYERPATVRAAIALLAQSDDAKVLAGGQTLGPMLNLRLAQPSLLVDITRIPELTHIDDTGDVTTLGACVTHAAIEDGRTADHWNGFLRQVAHGIAYRAIRTRGTLGGSLAHADPAADWVSCFIALGGDVVIAGHHGERQMRLCEFVRGALDSDLGQGELVTAVRLPKLSKHARAGYAKICRKTGEFAEAIGAVIDDRESGAKRCVIGATEGRPIVLEGELFPGANASTELLKHRIQNAGYTGDAYSLTLHAAAAQRALHQAYSHGIRP